MSDIDLGVKSSEKYNGMKMVMPEGHGESEDKTEYPRFHYCGPKELHLPDEGEMTVEFKKMSETSSVREDGTHWYECDIEVQKITDVSGESESGEDENSSPPTRRYNDAEEALDKLAEELRKR